MAQILGYIEEISDFSIAGWALDKALDASPLTMQLYIDGEFVQAVSCHRERPDLRSIKAARTTAGFEVGIPAKFCDGRVHVAVFKDMAEKVVTLSMVDGAPREHWEFCILDEGAPPTGIAGFVEAVSDGHVAGWAVDGSSDEPITLRMFVDNVLHKHVVCDGERPDVKALGHSLEAGFRIKMPQRFYDGRIHKFFFCPGDTDGIVALHDPSRPGSILQKSFADAAPRYVCSGRVDGLRDGAIRGWCFVLDRYLNRKFDCCEIIIRSGGQIIGQVTANQPRPDVAAAFDTSLLCGFSYVPPAELVIGRTLQLVFAVATYGLGNRSHPPPQLPLYAAN